MSWTGIIERKINRKRSLPKNWRILKYKLVGGDVYFNVQYKSIFFYWCDVTDYQLGAIVPKKFLTEDIAKKHIQSEVMSYVRLCQKDDDSSVRSVEKITF